MGKSCQICLSFILFCGCLIVFDCRSLWCWGLTWILLYQFLPSLINLNIAMKVYAKLYFKSTFYSVERCLLHLLTYLKTIKC